jgi:hypothetical protein
MMEMETETTLGMLGGVYRSERLARIAESKLTVAQLGDKLIQIRNRCLAREERQAAGWDLIGVSDGLEGYFDLNAIRDLPRGKIGSFASCNLRVDGVLYLAQFHLFEQQGTSSKPTAWAKSSGPSAGLPSLGKRR